jgi:hypothetical protein
MDGPLTRGGRKIRGCLCLILVIGTTAHCGTVKSVKQGNGNPGASGEALYYLDLAKPILTQSIESSDQAEAAKFVQVEVAEVLNPKRYSLTFEVYHQAAADTKILLGSFSLFPADNPGKFIVSTQGRVRNKGTIILSLTTPDKVDSLDSLKVGVKRIRFLKG